MLSFGPDDTEFPPENFGPGRWHRDFDRTDDASTAPRSASVPGSADLRRRAELAHRFSRNATAEELQRRVAVSVGADRAILHTARVRLDDEQGAIRAVVAGVLGRAESAALTGHRKRERSFETAQRKARRARLDPAALAADPGTVIPLGRVFSTHGWGYPLVAQRVDAQSATVPGTRLVAHA